MKKVLFVILLTTFGFAFLWSYERFNRDSIATVHPLKTIPSTANLILEINELTAFWHHFSETNIPWQALKNDPDFSELDDFSIFAILDALNKIDPITMKKLIFEISIKNIMI